MNSNERIGIIGAMDVEVALLVPMIDNCVIEKIGMITYYVGTMKNNPVVVAMSGIGKVNAAVCAATMINKFGVKTIINTGCGGSTKKGINQGDVVIGKAALEYDMDYDMLGGADGAIFYPDGSEIVYNELDEELGKRLLAAAKASGKNVFYDVIGTADRVLCDHEKGKMLNEKFGMTVCEMEGAAIAHACRLFGIPCGIVRSISDNADGNAALDYFSFKKIASETSAAIVIEFFSQQ